MRRTSTDLKLKLRQAKIQRTMRAVLKKVVSKSHGTCKLNQRSNAGPFWQQLLGGPSPVGCKIIFKNLQTQQVIDTTLQDTSLIRYTDLKKSRLNFTSLIICFILCLFIIENGIYPELANILIIIMYACFVRWHSNSK